MATYYTPSIEEFHVGFECEIYVTVSKPSEESLSCWYPIVFGNKHTKYENLVLGELIHTKTLDVNRFKVKHLDKEDIESVGFNEEGTKYYINTNKVAIYPAEWALGIKHSYKITKDDIIVFIGTIQNISELKVLLKQLNIITNG